MIWIEISHDSIHGGGDWGFGKCIWAPTHKKGSELSWLFWKNILEVKEEDVIVHLRGKGRETYIEGYSTVQTDGEETNERPPAPGEWDFSNSFYRAFLKNHHSFEENVYLYDLLDQKKDLLLGYWEKKQPPKNLFYVLQSGRLQCLNGAYLSPVDNELLKLLFDIYIDGATGSPEIPKIAQTSSISRQLKVRIGQQRFSQNVKKNYGHQCCFPGCGVTDKNFLVASHIARWADNEEKRGNTSNGLCLCLTHDKAFEMGYFCLDDDLKVSLSEDAQIQKSSIYKEHVASKEGQPIRTKKDTVLPDKESLREHRKRHKNRH